MAALGALDHGRKGQGRQSQWLEKLPEEKREGAKDPHLWAWSSLQSSLSVPGCGWGMPTC